MPNALRRVAVDCMRSQRAGQSALLFLDVAEILAREDIGYLIIGAFALSIHGIVRASSDVDSLLHASYSRFKKVAATFEAAGLEVTIRRGDDGDPIRLFGRDAADRLGEILQDAARWSLSSLILQPFWCV
jgi:hypothetical protein